MRLRSTFGLAAILAVILSTSALAATEKVKFDSGVAVVNPCNAQTAETAGQMLIEVAQQPDGSYRITFQYKGAGGDGDGGVYKVELNGRATVPPFEGSVDIPYSGRFAAKPPTPSFDVEGNVRIFMTGDGVPTSALLQTANTSCPAF